MMYSQTISDMDLNRIDRLDWKLVSWDKISHAIGNKTTTYLGTCSYYIPPHLKQHKFETRKKQLMAVVVAQLVDRSLPILEVRGSNPVIGNIIYYYLTVYKLTQLDDVETFFVRFYFCWNLSLNFSQMDCFHSCSR